ncbi:hypothetical protein GCM10023165_00220 [Variovorax defluvii]|uniref:Uncharacterized protein n=1 Tax=Variovorax defluvii TaxID=913761 RepID=A0ABP8GPQ1_9BURK
MLQRRLVGSGKEAVQRRTGGEADVERELLHAGTAASGRKGAVDAVERFMDWVEGPQGKPAARGHRALKIVRNSIGPSASVAGVILLPHFDLPSFRPARP